MTTKLCKRCGKTKPIDQFGKEPKNKDGAHSYCKECSGIIRDNCRKNNKEKNLKLGLISTEKLCLKCGNLKPINQFHKSFGSKDGLAENCKACRLDATHKLRDRYKTKNQQVDYGQEKSVFCRKCRQLKSSFLFHKYRSNKTGLQNICKECTKKLRRQKEYGITPKSLDNLVKQQNNKCVICKTDFIAEFHIDHSHVTQYVRGLLCGKCNLAIGLMKDSPAILRSAALYLEQSVLREKIHVA